MIYMSEENNIKIVKTLQEAIEYWTVNPGKLLKFEPRKGTCKEVDSIDEVEAIIEDFKHGIPATNEIIQFMHCGLCVKEKPRNVSPREWAQLEIGWTPHGLQVWCRRHETNVCHVDFEGAQHPANMHIHQRDDLGLQN